ncbi:hypothetical protein O7598_00375 [Micromonospora sp. WMMC241]|uniref:hypothetical protein n=1 Tax=Micromonospora sp. WMMC241 TaxID=3015159 RepID=UPI0022B6D5D1|nr:hypothetical protein [Micromonospora sp. WMMC241]MCZ7434844.1 hypothetical protein [Micromonospora sp. WMMC241]
MRRITRLTGVPTAVAAVLVALAGTGARASEVTPSTLCGPGYATVDQDPIRDAGTGELLGTVHLLRNLLTGFGCAVTVKSAYAGTLTPTRVHLDPEWLPFSVDEGGRRYAAGPVHGYVRAGCVIWGGSMTGPDGVVHQHERANPAIGGAVTCF